MGYVGQLNLSAYADSLLSHGLGWRFLCHLGEKKILSVETTQSYMFCRPSEKESTLKENTLFPLGANSFLE